VYWSLFGRTYTAKTRIEPTPRHTTSRFTMPRVGRNLTTPTPRAGPSIPKNPFDLLMSLRGYGEDMWGSDLDEILNVDSSSSDYDSDGSTVASTMLPRGASPGSGKSRKKKKGKGKGSSQVPAPKKTTSLEGSSKLPQQQQMESKEILIDKDGNIDLSHDAAMNMASKAFIKVIGGHFAKLYSKIDNLKTEETLLKTTVASLAEENKKLDKVRGNVPDPQTQSSMIPVIPTNDFMIRPSLPPAPQKQVGTPSAREVLKRNLVKQVIRDNTIPMNIDKFDAEPE